MTADFQGKVDVGVGLATGTPNPATAVPTEYYIRQY